MPKTERDLNTRDAKRDIGAELLASVREMKAETRGRTYQLVVAEVAWGTACFRVVAACICRTSWGLGSHGARLGARPA